MNIDYPFHFDGRGRTATAGDDEHICDMLEQLIFTSPGERVNRPDFGSGLLEAGLEPNSEALAAATQLAVQGALQHWLSELILVEAVQVESHEATSAGDGAVRGAADAAAAGGAVRKDCIAYFGERRGGAHGDPVPLQPTTPEADHRQ